MTTTITERTETTATVEYTIPQREVGPASEATMQRLAEAVRALPREQRVSMSRDQRTTRETITVVVQLKSKSPAGLASALAAVSG